ncbi:MAG: hypothetical protein H6878_04870 [Rhodobiaceae bacterium]|nr:hypothetical protein [Rhodobiaceae bacterium]MCC0015623.1 hypothetical protein [Rhodobiaceae bacterium]MCC0042519.1 hypothetical protein [Rhodobiaceae bacterium]MCC0054185.1 hypothetical protein [Rhodobiaceae bacterium]
MFRLLARFLGFWLFAAALVALVHDGARSIAASSLVVTSLGELWFSISAPSLNLTQAVIERYLHSVLWDPVMVSILQAPAAVVLMVIALFFALMGRRRRPVSVGLDLR